MKQSGYIYLKHNHNYYKMPSYTQSMHGHGAVFVNTFSVMIAFGIVFNSMWPKSTIIIMLLAILSCIT